MMKIMDTLSSGLVSSALQAICENLISLIGTEMGLILGADEEVRKLQRTLERIRAMVLHVEESWCLFSNSISNEAWKLWLEDVEKLCYSADDLLDGVSLGLVKYTAESNVRMNPGSQVWDMLGSFLGFNVPREISKIRQGLEDIAKEMDTPLMTELINLGSKYKNLKSKSASDIYSCANSSLINEDCVVGREKQKNEIIIKLLEEDARGMNVSVISLVGMGGIGKTTLAHVVYGDSRVVERFDLRCWAPVSINFDAVGITKIIIESLVGKKCKLGALPTVQFKLRDLLKGKRFLIVLDDYWSEEYRNWDTLSSPFGVGEKGSKIIVTTRSTVVSQIVGSVSPYYLDGLTDEDCWELMKQRVHMNRTAEGIAQVEEIGRMIAKKCKGLPLAAKTLGSMLHFENDTTWNYVLESEIWDLPKDKNDMLPALTLSYNHLPAHLKKCFAYCSTFPKNYEFDVEELVLLWMAEGFIRPVGNERLENTGANYFKDLLSRSFFQFSHDNIEDNKVFKMHDLIHSMARLVSANTCCFFENKSSTEECRLVSNARNLCLHHNCVQPLNLEFLNWCKNLRSFMVMNENLGKSQVSYDLLLKMKSLRILGLSGLGLEELPNSIGCLKHLRYLNLSGNLMKNLPKSITKLVGLQTLKLDKCPNLVELPDDMKKLVSLRHLHFDVKQLNRMPPEFGRLVNLQTLSAFLVGSTKGDGIGELKNMKLLRGSICIKNLENILNEDEAKESMLDAKQCLDKLELEWSDSNSYNRAEGILAGLCPHENLKELTLTKYNSTQSPSWLSSPACKLSSIHLLSCRHPSLIKTLGKLQHLKSLHVEGILDWFEIGQEFTGFPSLVSLTIKDMPHLADWDSIDIHSLPCLQSFKLMECPSLVHLPSLVSLSSLKDLAIDRCPKIKSLPGLPVFMKKLVIVESDKIASRCRSEEDEDWHKIRYIESVEINCVEVFTRSGFRRYL